HQDYLQNPASRQCEIIGDRAKVTMDLPALGVTVNQYDNPVPSVFSNPDFDRNQLFLDEARHFLKCVETRSQPIVTLEDGLESLRIALAAKQSIATSRLVELVSSRIH